MIPYSQTEENPAATASSRYITSRAVSSAPREAGDKKPAELHCNDCVVSFGSLQGLYQAGMYGIM